MTFTADNPGGYALTAADGDALCEDVLAVLRRLASAYDPPDPVGWYPDYDELVEQPFLEARRARDARRERERRRGGEL